MNPFAKQVPSVFSIQSPFQALCAMAAIKQLMISDYLIIVNYYPENPRNRQLLSLLEDYHLNYELINLSKGRLSSYSRLLKAFCHRNRRYKRLFLGDYRESHYFVTGSYYVSDMSPVVYLDDGNSTLALLHDMPEDVIQNHYIESYLKKIERRRGFDMKKNLLTIYSDVKNSKFNIEPLDISIALNGSSRHLRQSEDIFIVGTNLDKYCGPLGLDKARFVRKLNEIVVQLKVKNPTAIITYIPHGADESDYAKEICKANNIEFCRPKMMIELELINRRIIPSAIYGFTSTALFNLKKMYPQTHVVNILFRNSEENKIYLEYKMLSQYYSANGIHLNTVELS